MRKGPIRRHGFPRQLRAHREAGQALLSTTITHSTTPSRWTPTPGHSPALLRQHFLPGQRAVVTGDMMHHISSAASPTGRQTGLGMPGNRRCRRRKFLASVAETDTFAAWPIHFRPRQPFGQAGRDHSLPLSSATRGLSDYVEPESVD